MESAARPHQESASHCHTEIRDGRDASIRGVLSENKGGLRARFPYRPGTITMVRSAMVIPSGTV